MAVKDNAEPRAVGRPDGEERKAKSKKKGVNI